MILMENKTLSWIIIVLLLAVIGLLVVMNHQIDTVSHAVGVKESKFEEELHNEIGGEKAAAGANETVGETGHID